MEKEVKFNLREGIQLAKSKWTENLANKIHDLANTPRYTWQAVNILKEWIQGHHKLAGTVRSKNKKGFFSESNEENLDLLSLYFQSVFNSKVNIDWEVLNDLSQKPINNNINSSLSWKEFIFAINKLTLYKAPGLNGISSNTIKALNDENMSVLLKIYSEYFNGELDIQEWKIWKS